MACNVIYEDVSWVLHLLPSQCTLAEHNSSCYPQSPDEQM